VKSLRLRLSGTPAGRKLLFALLYLSEGAPIGFLWWALPTRLRGAGVSVEDITTFTALLVIPWTFKFAWAPLVDVLRSSWWGRRSWIVASQTFMGLTLLPLLVLDLRSDLPLIVPLLLLHAVAAATQDVAIDAYAVATVPTSERGALNGWMQTGMLLGRSLFGGVSLILFERLGSTAVHLLLIGTIWGSMAILLLSRGTTEEIPVGGVGVRWGEFRERAAVVLRTRETWLGLLFALIAGAGFEAVGAVAGPFLLDHGLTSEQVGAFFALPVIVGMTGGSLLGGILSDRFGRRRALAFFVSLLATDILLLAGVDAWSNGGAAHVLLGSLAVLYFCIGLFTASSYAFFMDITDPALGATQFSAYMGATNACESWSAVAVGGLIARGGYPLAFVVMAGVSLIALPVLKLMRENVRGTRE